MRSGATGVVVGRDAATELHVGAGLAAAVAAWAPLPPAVVGLALAAGAAAVGRVVYSSPASYHAYLERPVLLAFLSRRSE